MSDLFTKIHDQRIALVEMLSSFRAEEWQTPSLCEGWTVHEVVAHLTMPINLGVPSLVFRMLGARGNYARLSDRYARSQSKVPSSELVAILKKEASNNFTPPGFGPEAPLTDSVIHGYDIAIPTHRSLVIPEETSKLVLNFLVSTKAEKDFTKRGLVTGLRLECSDGDWSYGSGSLVRGPTTSLLLSLTGRAAGFASLEGDGVADLRRRSSSA